MGTVFGWVGPEAGTRCAGLDLQVSNDSQVWPTAAHGSFRAELDKVSGHLWSSVKVLLPDVTVTPQVLLQPKKATSKT